MFNIIIIFCDSFVFHLLASLLTNYTLLKFLCFKGLCTVSTCPKLFHVTTLWGND